MDEPDSSSVATKSGDESSEGNKTSTDVYDFENHEAKKVKTEKLIAPLFIFFIWNGFRPCVYFKT